MEFEENMKSKSSVFILQFIDSPEGMGCFRSAALARRLRRCAATTSAKYDRKSWSEYPSKISGQYNIPLVHQLCTAFTLCLLAPNIALPGSS